MLKIDTSITIIGIITVTSLVSPWLTTYMNNKHQLKLREYDYKEFKFENETIYIRNLCEQFMRSVGYFLNRTDYEPGNTSEMSKHYYSLLPYIPKEKLNSFKKFMELTQIRKSTSTVDNELTELLRNEILPTINKISNKG